MFEDLHSSGKDDSVYSVYHTGKRCLVSMMGDALAVTDWSAGMFRCWFKRSFILVCLHRESYTATKPRVRAQPISINNVITV